MKHILYLFWAFILLIILSPLALISIIYRYVFFPSSARRSFKLLLYTIALSIDAFGNVLLSSLFNHIFITEEGYGYGNWHETISQVTGENELMGTLTPAGIRFKETLDWVFEKDHCVKAVKHKEIRCERYLNRIHRIEQT